MIMATAKVIDIRDYQIIDENCLTTQEWERLRMFAKIGFRFLTDKQFEEVERLIAKYTYRPRRDYEPT